MKYLTELEIVLAEEMSAKIEHSGPGKEIGSVQYGEMSALMRQSLARPDLGVGVIWSPENTADGRPTAIFARGVASLATAALEMQASFDPNSRSKSQVAHFVFSLSTSESATVSKEQLIQSAVATLDGMTLPDGTAGGWSKHALVAVVHEDTLVWGDPDENGGRKLLDGNKHCHIMACSKDNEGHTFDRTHEYLHLSKSLREREVEYGMNHDFGLYVKREYGIDRSDFNDWAARNQQKAIERAERQAHNFLSDVSELSSKRDWEDRIHHDLRRYLTGCRDRGEQPLMSDAHVIANRLSLQIEGVIDGRLTFRMMERANPSERRKTWVDYYGDTRHIAARWKPTPTLITLDESRVARSPLDGRKSKKPPHEWLVAKHEEALKDRNWLLNIGSHEAAEEEYLRVIAADPGRVSRDYVNGRGKATFFFDDVEQLVAQHVTEDWAGVAERALRADPTVKIVRNQDEASLARGEVTELRHFSESGLYTGVDGYSPLFTIESQRDKTERFDQLLRQMLSRPDPDFNRSALDQAIATVLAEERLTNPDFGFDREQYAALAAYDRALTVMDGPPGAGKSSMMKVHRIYAELTGREIRGFTTAEKAAGVLREESGIQSVNQSRALTEAKRNGTPVLPAKARFIFDEFSMADYDAGIALLEQAIEQGATGVLGGGLDQLQNIAAGNTFGLACRAALDLNKAADNHAFTRLKHTYRQQSAELAFMQLEVRKGSKAINTAWKAGFAAYLEHFRPLVVEHATRADEVRAIAEDIVDAMRAGLHVISPGRSYEDCLYISRHVRAALGLEKPEGERTEFVFNRSTMELSVGDHILFRENRGTDEGATYKNGKPKLYVRNGDVGIVEEIAQDSTTGRWAITVKLDNGRTITFDPDSYHDVEYAYASTIYANQGSKARVVIGSILPASEARDVQVTFTRATHVLRIHTHMQWDKIIESLTSDRSLAPADDSLLFQSVVKRTGGPQSPWARTVETAMKNASDPLRRQHAAAMAQVARDFQAEIRGILDANLPTRERDRALKEAAEKHPRLGFVAWCASRMEEIQMEYASREFHMEPVERQRLLIEAWAREIKETDRLEAERIRRSVPDPAKHVGHLAVLDNLSEIQWADLNQAWNLTYFEAFHEPTEITAQEAATIGSKTYETLLARAMWRISPVGEEWESRFLARLGVTAPCGVEKAHNLPGRIEREILNEARAAAGLEPERRTPEYKRELAYSMGASS